MIEKIKSYFNLIRLFFGHTDVYQTIKKVKQENLTYLGKNALADLVSQLHHVRNQNLKGIIIEAGCALGGSALVLASAKEKQRPFLVYDMFEMIPPPSDADGLDAQNRFKEIRSHSADGINGDKYYGYQENLLQTVKSNFQRYSLDTERNAVTLIKGDFEKTLIVNSPVSLAHLDCDWHDSVIVCLQRIVPNLEKGGVLILDDYDAWSGCKKAVDTFFADKLDNFEFVMKSRLHIIRK